MCIPTETNPIFLAEEHTYIHTHTHTHFHMHMYTYIPTYMHTYMHTKTCIPAYIHTCIYTYIHTYIHAYTNMYSCIHTYINTYIHTYIHAANACVPLETSPTLLTGPLCLVPACSQYAHQDSKETRMCTNDSSYTHMEDASMQTSFVRETAAHNKVSELQVRVLSRSTSSICMHANVLVCM